MFPDRDHQTYELNGFILPTSLLTLFKGCVRHVCKDIMVKISRSHIREASVMLQNWDTGSMARRKRHD
jgi:hypothetical protein